MFNRHFNLMIHTAAAFVGTTPIVWVRCEIPYYLARVAERRLGCVAESSHVAFAFDTERIWWIKTWTGLHIQSAYTFNRERNRNNEISDCITATRKTSEHRLFSAGRSDCCAMWDTGFGILVGSFGWQPVIAKPGVFSVHALL
jgi:hypothetical protein